MNSLSVLLGVLFFAGLINIPFGYLRSRSRRYSIRWFLYIHIPVPVIIFLRVGLGFDWKAIPLIVAASIAGQFAGGRMGKG